MTSSLVGSEMCIRDRASALWDGQRKREMFLPLSPPPHPPSKLTSSSTSCLLYTSDAADDM
eukprot:7541767-Prorocentrum_lima.AAC.1